MRKINRILAIAIAAALCAEPCMANRFMGEVCAEESEVKETISAGEIQGTAEAEEGVVTVEGVSVKAGESVDALETPAQFHVEVKVKAPDDVSIDEVEIGYSSKENGKELSFVKRYEKDSAWYPGVSGDVSEITVDLNEYMGAGTYQLQYISIYGENCSLVYNYNEESQTFIQGDGTDETAHRFAYHGEADYTVAKSEKEDDSWPEITSVKRVTSEEIYTSTKIQYEVGYTEEGSGVKKINLIFSKEGSDLSDPYIYEDGILDPGMGSIIISSDYREPGKYQLEGFSIEDYAGHRRYYGIDESGTDYVSYDGKEGEKRLRVSETDRSYEVKLMPYEGVSLKEVRMVIADGKDPNQLSAGDSFEVVATVVNNSALEKQVDSEACNIAWARQDGNSWDHVFGTGEAYTLHPKEEGEVHFKVQVSPYAVTGARTLQNIDIISDASGYEGIAYYAWEEGKLTGVVAETLEEGQTVVGYVDYGKEIDYTVAISEKPDEEAPYVEHVSIGTQEIKAPGSVSFDIHIPDEGHAKVKELELCFVDKENVKNVLYLNALYNGKLEYSTEKNCYVYEAELNAATLKGIYELSQVFIADEAQNSRFYIKDGSGKLVDENDSKNVLEPCEMMIAEAATEDADFEVPALKDVAVVEENVKNGGKLQFKIDAEDESGLSYVYAVYKNHSSQAELELSSWDIKKEADGYLCEFNIDKYCEAGNYKLELFELHDGSVRQNGVMYRFDEETQTLYPMFDGMENIILKESLDIKVTGAEDMVITDITKDNIDAVADSVKQGGTVVVKGTDIHDSESGAIPKEFLVKAKEKELTVIVPDVNSSSEIVIDGSKMSDIPDKDVELKVQRGDMTEEEITVGSAKDDIYYPVDVVVSDTKIPFTLRVRLDADFLKQCEGRPIRFSKIAADGSSVILQDNMNVDEEGYLEVEFADGIGENISSQMLNAGRNKAAADESNLGENNLDGNVPDQESSGIRFIVSARTEEGITVGSGDINGDKKIDILDLMLCLNHVSKKSTLEGERFMAADVDGNQKVDLLDLMRILNYVSKKTETVN